VSYSTIPRHRATHQFAQHLASAHDPLGFLGALPFELRTDPGFVCEAIGVLALAANTTESARHAGMSRMGLRKAMSPGANPSFTTVVRVADALGLRFELVAA
jgi:probable addiction module antidote protein